MAKKKDFETRQETEVAIPAAVRVKHAILDARESAIRTLGDVMYRRGKGLPVHTQVNQFQANVFTLYQHLRLKFKKTHQIRKLDNFIKKSGVLPWPVLYESFCMLQEKIEKMKITKIERKEAPEDERM